MEDIENRIEYLECKVKEYKNELRRLKSTINKVEKLGLLVPNELVIKKDIVEVDLKELKQELKLYKKINEIIK